MNLEETPKEAVIEPLKYASVAQTKRWVKCMKVWAVKHNKNTSRKLHSIFNFPSDQYWYWISSGTIKKVRQDIMLRTIDYCKLDVNYINGISDHRKRPKDIVNIFEEFSSIYLYNMDNNLLYQASQIVRKAALFLYETLVPKDFVLTLNIHNHKNTFEKIEIDIAPVDTQVFSILVFGGVESVQFCLRKRLGSSYIPIIEGDLNASAVSTIKSYILERTQSEAKSKETLVKFDTNAKSLTDKILTLN